MVLPVLSKKAFYIMKCYLKLGLKTWSNLANTLCELNAYKNFSDDGIMELSDKSIREVL